MRSTSPNAPRETTREPGFADSATRTLTSLRDAIDHAVSRLPGRIDTAMDLKRALKVDYSLCWRLFELLKAEEPLAAAHRVPSKTSLRRFADAAKQQGLSPDIVRAVREAAADFDKFVHTHASTRASFNAMVAALVHEDTASEATLLQRKTTFRGESELWGAQIDTQYKLVGVTRNPDGSMNPAKIVGKFGFQRLRAEALPIAATIPATISHLAKPTGPGEDLLDPATQTDVPFALLPEFCTNPLPKLRVINGDRWRYLCLDHDQLGRLGKVDLVVGNQNKNQSGAPNSQGRLIYIIGTRIITPVEYCVMDLLLHQPTMANLTPRFRVSSDTGLSIQEDVTLPAPQFPAYGKIVNLGPAHKAAPPTGIPRHAEMLHKLCTCTNWNLAEFHLYRVTMQYPIFRTVASVWLDVTP